MRKSLFERSFETVAFGISDLLTGRKALLLQQKRPFLYWCIAIPVMVIPIAALVGLFLWIDGIIRL